MKFKMIVIIAFSFLFNMAQAGFLPIAHISKISGTALINHKKVEVGAEVSEGNEVRVGHLKDYLEITYQNGHVVRLTGGTMKVHEFTPKKSVLEVVKGTLFSLIHKLTPDEKFIVKTKRASFAVRGTKFFIQEKKDESYLCVCEGTVVATNNANPKLEVDVKKDQDLFVSDKKSFKVTLSSKAMRQMGNEVFDSLK